MPMYDFQCQAELCGRTFDRMVRLVDLDLLQACPKCGEESLRLISVVGVILKGDGWSTKNSRIAKQMRHKNKWLASKERDQKHSGMVPSLTPNVGGVEVDSWSEAKNLAASKGKDISSYDSHVRREKAGAL